MSLKRTFGNALRGLGQFLAAESNNRIHIPAGVLVIGAGIYFQIAAMEWLMIAVANGMVFNTEAINVAL